MPSMQTSSKYDGVDAIEGVVVAWNDQEISLAERARAVSRLFMKARLTLEGAGRLCNASPASIHALLELSTMEDDDLQLVSDASPPVTTWLLFAGADSESIRAGISAFVSLAAGQPALASVYDAMQRDLGPTVHDRLASVSGEALAHLAKKAKEYGKLNDWQRRFLASVAVQRRTGKRLTEPQLEKLKEALIELVDGGVVRHGSPDNDQTLCDEVLSALGV
jgi:hypothetical protein